MTTGDYYLKRATKAIDEGLPGPAHRHLLRAWDAWPSPLTDDQIDRWASQSERLDLLEEKAGFKWGGAVDSAGSAVVDDG